MVVVVNRLTARDAETARHVEARFRDRMRAVDRRPGFLSFELWRDAGNPLILSSVTRWESRAAFEAWVASDDFREAHARHAATRVVPGAPPAVTSEVTVHEVLDDGGAPPVHPA